MSFDNFVYSIDDLKISISSFVFIALLIFLAPDVVASKTFSAFRMQQFDIHGLSYGSKGVAINSEVKVMSGNWKRKCLLVRLPDINNIHDLISKANSLLIVLSSASFAKDRESLQDLEQNIVNMDINIPIYFIIENDNNKQALNFVQTTLGHETSKMADSALSEMVTAATLNTFFAKYVSSFNTPSLYSRPLENFDLINIQSKLVGSHQEEVPTIAIITHMDSYGLIPSLSYGCDSNGSGLTAFLEIARILKLLYSSNQLKPRYNVVFLLTSGGKFTYLGAKRWNDDNFENTNPSQISDIALVLCLDSLGNGNETFSNLYVHVAKSPKEASNVHAFYKILKAKSASYFQHTQKTNMKENLGDFNNSQFKHDVFIVASNPKSLAWEHEVFLPKIKSAVTLSSYKSASHGLTSDHSSQNTLPDAKRTDSVYDNRCKSLIPTLKNNIQIITESLVEFIFFQDRRLDMNADMLMVQNSSLSEDLNTGGPSILSPFFDISDSHLLALMQFVSHSPRAQQLLAKDSATLANILGHFADIMKDLQILSFRADKREPEFVFYNDFEGRIELFRSKPAIFDLYIAIAIGAYLSLVYFALMYFNQLSTIWINLVKPPTNKPHPSSNYEPLNHHHHNDSKKNNHLYNSSSHKYS